MGNLGRCRSYAAEIVGAVVFVALTSLLVWPPEARADRSLEDLTGPWQLFVDDYPVAVKSDVVRTYHPFQKYAGNPVLTPTEAWEDSIAYIYGTVLPTEDGTGLRMWYHTLRPEDTNNDGSNILYATSTDGIAWTKPILNIRSWHGSDANNMIYDRPGNSGITSVMHTPWDPDPNRRYKFMNYDTGGYWGAYSADGLHTQDLATNPMITDGSDVGQFMYDPHTELFRGYVKINTYVNGLRRRSVGHTETTSIDSWPLLQFMMEPDTFDDRWVPAGTVQRTHMYGLSAFAYESMYIGFLWIFRATDADGYTVGPVYTEIVSSHDGVHWEREEGDRPAMLPLGSAGAWDDGQLYTARAPVLRGDQLYVYYGACDDAHGTATKKLNCSIGLATVRKDGFASLDAGVMPGTVTTKKLAGAGGPLHVNCSAVGGWVKAEVLDENGVVVPGYSAAECNAVTTDSINEVVTWAAHSELPGGMAAMSLRFVLQNASLYSFMAGESVTVIEGPTISANPADQSVPLGGTAVFQVTAGGTEPLSYQWRRNLVNLSDGGHFSGAGTAALTVTNVTSNEAGYYDCVVTNPHGSVTSAAASLSVQTAVLVGVGTLPGGTTSTISGITADGAVVCGTSAGQPFIWTVGEGIRGLGLPAGATSGSAVGVGVLNGNVVAAVDSNLGTNRAQTWTGNTAGVGSYAALPKVGDTREWTVAALGTNGTSNLWIAGSSLSGGDGNGREAVRYQQSTHTTLAAPLPATPSGTHDHSDFYGISDTGVSAGRVQYPGVAPTGGARQAWYYTGSTSILLNTLYGAPASAYEAVVRCVSRDGQTLGGWSYRPGYGANITPCLWQSGAVVAVAFIPGGDSDNAGEVLALNQDGTLAGGYSVYSPSGSEEAFIWDEAHGTRSLATVLTTAYGVDLAGWTLQRVTAISADGKVIAGNALHNGVTEGFVVRFVESISNPPLITQQPADQQVCTGGVASFSVQAIGGGTLSYQWQKGDSDLSEGGHYEGTATDMLTITGADAGDAGDYRCVVTGDEGPTTSNAATLTVWPSVPADFDADGDVDLDDVLLFAECSSGPNVPMATGCGNRDLDGDGDVDQSDFGRLQRCYGAAGMVTDPACAN